MRGYLNLTMEPEMKAVCSCGELRRVFWVSSSNQSWRGRPETVIAVGRFMWAIHYHRRLVNSYEVRGGKIFQSRKKRLVKRKCSRSGRYLSDDEEQKLGLSCRSRVLAGHLASGAS